MDPVMRRNMWRKRIEQCLSSGLTISEWCTLNKVPPSSLYGWIAKFRKEESSLFTGQTTTEWIEITKENLAASVAMVPKTSAETTLRVPKPKKAKQEILTDDESLAFPSIHARINGVEMMISAGCIQSDIEHVFKAAMAL